MQKDQLGESTKNSIQKKYGIWLLPSGDANIKLETLINNIADELGSVKFIPHVSVAGVSCSDSELEAMKEKVGYLSHEIRKFNITLEEFGTKGEFHRSLYLLAKSESFDDLYQKTSAKFPYAIVDRNKLMPHLSVLYGNFPAAVKQNIVSKYQNLTITFEAVGLDLCLSEGPENEWRSVFHADFRI